MRIERPDDVPAYVRWPEDPSYDKTLNNVCNYVRLLNHLGRIVEAMEVAAPNTPGDAFKPHLATYLKLLLTASYARQFLNVGSRYTEKLYYLDVLSASGLTYPGDGKVPVPGSCFWVPLAHQPFEEPLAPPKLGFRRAWAFDANEAALSLLQQRRDRLATRAGFQLPPYEYVAGDVNEALPAVLDRLAQERRADQAAGSPASLVLAFIDNLALDVTMASVQRIQSSVRADLVVHLPVRAIWRSCQQARETDVEARRLTAFFGSEGEWRKIADPGQIPAVYQGCVEAVTRSEFQPFEPVLIRSQNQEFALCIYTRKTGGAGSGGWVASIQKLAEACNQFDEAKLQRVMNVATGKQKKLDLGLG